MAPIVRGETSPGSPKSHINDKKVVNLDEVKPEGNLVYRREGVIIEGRRKEDPLLSGTLKVTDTKQHGVLITWEVDSVQQTIEVARSAAGALASLASNSSLNGSDGAGVGVEFTASMANGAGEALNGNATQQNIKRAEPEKSKNGSRPSSNCSGGVHPEFIVGSPNDADWAVISDPAPKTPKDSVRFRTSTSTDESPMVKFSSGLEEKRQKLSVDMKEVGSYRLVDNTVTLLMTDGTTHNKLMFIDEGPEEFLNLFRYYMAVKPSTSDANLFLLTDKKTAALDQSLSELKLFEGTDSGHIWKTLNDLQRDPVTTSMSLLSRVAEKIIYSPVEKEYRPSEDMAQLLQNEVGMTGSGSLDCTLANADGDPECLEWQLVNNKKKNTILQNLVFPERGTPVCQLDWELHRNADGSIEDVPGLLEKVFRGGVEHNVRAEIWRFLLGYHQWHHTHEVRKTNRTIAAEEYYRMKGQWKTITEDQENRFAGFRERKTQVEKDVSRTDRSHQFYQGDSNPKIDTLKDILMTYVMYNFDLGYVQGMSDLLSPILYVIDDEVDAFWCFVAFMDRVPSNFYIDQLFGIKLLLKHLATIVKYLDPKFYNYLERKDCGDMFFCFRWVLIWFKREFSFDEILRLWEVLWTKKPCKNFPLLMSVALLDNEKTVIMENEYGLTEILKHVNDMSFRIDLSNTINKAEAIYLALRQDNEISEEIVNILGVAPDTNGNVRSSIPEDTSLLAPSFQVRSQPVPIKGGQSHRERSNTENSNCSLNHSSSVEVLSEEEELRDKVMLAGGLRM